FPAMGRIAPNYFVQDGVIPRTKLPEVLERLDELSEEYGMQVANVFHAGDGNLHPLVCYDGRKEGEAERAEELSGLILDACLEAGGMAEILEHNEGDLTAVLQAGVPLAGAQARFAEAGQMLALDPPLGAGDATTIGGLVATGDSGPLRHRYGGVRDLILGITI